MPFAAGQQVGPYQIIEQLGQGGMATVFKAYHASLDRYVAIKVLHPAFTEDPNFLARFQREARVVARLEHPNIVPIYDFSEHEGRPYLVMKFIEGQTLKAAMEHSPLSPAQTLTIVEAVGAALSYAHQRDVLHRDVKPSNVLLANDRNIYLADFGLARMAQAGESTLTSDRMVGTPQYISPEQALSKPNLDLRTDVYSLGVMLYEMVVGRVPFNADTPFAIIHDHIYTPLPLPRQVNPDVPEQVERVLLRALAKDPADRFQDVPALLNAFRSALKGELAEGMASPVITPSLAQAPTAQVSQAALAATKVELKLEKSGNLPPASTEVAAAAPPTQAAPAKAQRHSNARYWVFGIVAVVLIAAVSCLLLVNRLPEILVALGITKEDIIQAIQETPEGGPRRETLQVPPLDIGEEYQGLAEQALNAWRNKDLPAARQIIEVIVEEAQEDWGVYQGIFEYWGQNEAYLLIGFTIFRPDGLILAYPKDLEERLHSVLYMVAQDPLAADFLMQNAERPLFKVADIRRELYFGSPEAAKERLGELNSRPLEMRNFPEVRLLEAEIFYRMGDYPRAEEIFNALKADPQMPEWVRNAAAGMLEKIKQKP